MTAANDPINLDDLMAYVDGQLGESRRRAVEALCQRDPAVARTVATYMEQRSRLRAAFEPVASEAVPPRLLEVEYRWRPSRRRMIAVMAATLAAGMALGSVTTYEIVAPLGDSHRDSPQALAELPDFAQRAVVAHVVYSPDVRRPVEIGADQRQQLVAWLSRRLGSDISPPVLDAIGYELIGGRLLPGEQGPVAQFMYHDALGERLTLYVAREPALSAEHPMASYRFGQEGPVNVFYWVDKNFGYAISGGFSRQALLRVTQEIYRQLETS